MHQKRSQKENNFMKNYRPHGPIRGRHERRQGHYDSHVTLNEPATSKDASMLRQIVQNKKTNGVLGKASLSMNADKKVRAAEKDKAGVAL